MRPRPELAELDAWQFAARLDAVTQIYAAAMSPPAHQLPGRRAIMERHAGYTAFRAVVVTLSPAAPGNGRPPPVIAFAYGFHGESGQWWHDLVRVSIIAELDAAAADKWLGNSFEVAEVHVHPRHQGQGLGRKMMLRLTGGRPERTAVLSTPAAQTRARRLYHSLGFTDLMPGFSFPGADPPYAIMGAELPLADPPLPRRDRLASPSR